MVKFTIRSLTGKALPLALLLLLAIALAAAGNHQELAAPTNIVAELTTDGNVKVSWDADDAPVHRVGWTNQTDLVAAYRAGDVYEAFYFADTKREADYVVKYLPVGQIYWFSVGAGSERFSQVTFGDYISFTIPCSPDDYDRNDWGSHPSVPDSAVAEWTLPSDNVNSPDLTMDHHVALEDAHISGGCAWSDDMKDGFSSDLDNLNPTTRSFNSSKGSRTPDQLTGIAAGIINTSEEKCSYATQHEDIKTEYQLTMTSDEQTTVDAWLALCR